MNIVLINGSPRENGCTKVCLLYLKNEFEKDKDISCKIIDIPKNISHCANCRICKTQNSPCILDATIQNISKVIENCDGLVIGSPVYYYGITSQLQAFLTRLCYSCPKILKHKLCSFFSVSRRTGNTNAFDQVMKIYQMHNAIMVGGNYVNEIYGDVSNDVYYDKEGLQSLRFIASNFKIMIPLLKEVSFTDEDKIHTNFISREYKKLLLEKDDLICNLNDS